MTRTHRAATALVGAAALIGLMAPQALSDPVAAGTDVTPSTAPIFGKWERLGVDEFETSLWHEVRVFHREGDEWVGTFKHQRTPSLDTPTPAAWDRGDFRGAEVDPADLDCWLTDCPADITFAVSGEGTFVWGHGPYDGVTYRNHFVTTETGMLWWIAEWDGRPDWYATMMCPWYPNFEDALAANPSGVFDCYDFADLPYDGQTIEFQIVPSEHNCTDGYDNDGDGSVDLEDPDCTI